MTYSPPSRRARWSADWRRPSRRRASDSANAPIALARRQRRAASARCCASVPCSRIGSATSELFTVRITASVALAQRHGLDRERVGHVVAARAAALRAGMVTPIRPSAAALATRSRGIRAGLVDMRAAARRRRARARTSRHARRRLPGQNRSARNPWLMRIDDTPGRTPRAAGVAVAGSSSGSTRVSPTTVMKLVSPFQRGTTCMCRWSSTPAPAGLPRFRPMLKPCGAYTSRQHALGAPASARISSCSSSASRSASRRDVARAARPSGGRCCRETC